MKIGLLTSSRADFGIYYPLAKALREDKYFNLEIIAFGTHLSPDYGFTIDEITKLGFEVKHKIETLPKGDSAEAISASIGRTIISFSSFWTKNSFDLVLCLGDRYEMYAAVSAASPFNVKFAHIHAGETTLGAIDNAYRHSISLMSKYLFVSTEEYKKRALKVVDTSAETFNVGALSIDNLRHLELYSKDEFKEVFNIDLHKNTILSTFHPETISLDVNEAYINELINAFQSLSEHYQILITLPNADTMGLMIREKLLAYGKMDSKVIIVESLGMKGYLSAMKHSAFLLGNTSSGFVEAAYFPKWVINLGERQKGRLITPNIKSVNVTQKEIMNAVTQINNTKILDCNIYGEGDTAELIINTIKHTHETS